jgi:hypothetical protein
LTKTLDTLIPDIYSLFDGTFEFNEERVQKFGQNLAGHLAARLSEEREDGKLRMSSTGVQCDRRLWLQVNKPEQALPHSPATKFKFLYGDILEELVLFLAAEAGHSVEGTQTVLEIEGVKGHRDAVVDGTTIDVKSASGWSMAKFENHEVSDESFGYLTQLGSYLYAGRNDPVVLNKDVAGFLAVNKENGDMVLDLYPLGGIDYSEIMRKKKAIVSLEEMPPRGFNDKEEGKSGNRKLDTACRYCPFKKVCWPDVTMWMYSKGPVFLTTVQRTPDVPQAEIIYN